MNHSRSRALSLLAVSGLVFAACSAAATPTPAPAGGGAPAGLLPAPPAPPPPPAPAGGGAPEALITAAKAEGTLTTIALPHDWCNYGEAIETFKTKYGLTVTELDPNAGSGAEVEAITANKEKPGPQG